MCVFGINQKNKRNWTDEDEDKDNYCCHKVMTMKRRRRKTTRTDDSKDYYDKVMIMERRTTKRTWTYIWLPMDNTLFITLAIQ